MTDTVKLFARARMPNVRELLLYRKNGVKILDKNLKNARATEEKLDEIMEMLKESLK